MQSQRKAALEGPLEKGVTAFGVRVLPTQDLDKEMANPKSTVASGQKREPLFFARKLPESES